MKNKIKLFSLKILTIFIFLFLFTDVNAEDLLPNIIKSESFKQWEQLSDDQKNNTIEPSAFDVSYYTVRSKSRSNILGDSLESSYYPNKSVKIIKNQKGTSSCWAFSASSALEASIYSRYNNSFEYSPMHIDYRSSTIFNLEVGSGGNTNIAVAYLASNYGPVLESDFKMSSVYDDSDSSLKSVNSVDLDVPQQARLLDSMSFSSIYKTISDGTITYSDGYDTITINNVNEIRNQVKQVIKRNGAVISSTYLPDDAYLSSSGDMVSEYYNSDTNSYFYDGNKGSNHQITIVGWDDNYNKSNFNSLHRPLNNGAYIVQNSWGNRFGDDGYYYISYDDVNIEKVLVGFTNVEKINNEEYDNIYEYDNLGLTTYLYPSNSSNTSYLKEAYMANVFTRKCSSVDEKLNQVGVFVADNNPITIYVNKTSDDLSNLEEVTTISSITSGYHVIDLSDYNIILPKGSSKYVVSVKYSDDSRVTIPLESDLYASGISSVPDITSTASSNAGESFYSGDGSTWIDLVDYEYRYSSTVKKRLAESNACIKAFTSGKIVNKPSINYKTHVQSYGWEASWKKDGVQSGTTGEAKRLEGIKINLSGDYSGSILYKTHIQSYGWESEWKRDGSLSGTMGEAKRLEAIQIKLDGDISNLYDVYYRVHAQHFGWLDWAKNGEKAGTAGYAYRLEAIQIVLVEKDGNAPGNTDNCYYQKHVLYNTHVQTYGWQGYFADGDVSGTTGEAKRLEGIQIILDNQEYSGNIEYRTHIQSYGWESSWKKNNEISGTSGEAKRLEAIQIRLTGDMNNNYDVYYRVHAQHFGWLGWAKNGEKSGTAGYAYRLEAIQIVLVKKGGSAPGSTVNKFYEA